jgi:LuxR family transcriptional regulator, maltose regulon positive regulatory protein
VVENGAVSSGVDESNRAFVIVRTKLLVPLPRTRTVPRPQLLEVLEEGLSTKLTLVCAPTGWGKTSLLADWASRHEGRVAWVTLDPGDDEPMRFWRYVVGALSSVEPSLAATAQRRLGAPVLSISDEVLPVLVNNLAELRRPLVLMLDDYHLIANPAIHEDVGYLLDRLPHTLHVVIAAHADPPLRLGRLRAIGDLSEMRGEQLRFTDAEAAALLNQVHGLDLRPDEVATVQRRTEGWVAGINLAALSLKRGSDRDRVLDAIPADDRFLVDYLWNEVVLSQSRSVRHFLMRTAILDRLTGDLCNAVSERADGAEMLRELERANLFVVPLDRARAWFRYHDLFRSLLLTQL